MVALALGEEKEYIIRNGDMRNDITKEDVSHFRNICSSGLLVISGCSYQSDISKDTISEDEAIAIASSRIPPGILLHAHGAYAYLRSEQDQNGIWLVNLYGLDITREELEQFGWQEGDNISFDNFSPGTNEYYSVLIYIDGKTGEIISQKAGGVWLGPGPPVEVPSS